MQLKNLLTISFLTGFTVTFAQTVSINKINERRSTSDSYFDNRCEIEFKVSGDEVRKYKLVKIAKILTIVDDQGLDLIKEVENYRYEEIDNNAQVKIETKIPSRKASSIKEISGEIILYNPTDVNGAIIKISDYRSKTNVNLLPTTTGAQLVYLTKESIEKYAKDQKLKKEEEIKKLPEPVRKVAEEIVKAFDGLSNFSDSPNEITFLIQGDESKLVDLYFENENGQKIKRNGSSQINNLITYSFSENLNPNWKLVLNIENNASIKKVPFSLTNIILP
jgi:hypothetical protein